MKVLMVGATGDFAGFVLPELTRRGAVVRALVREPGKQDAAIKQGAAETAIGDLRNPESLRAAAQGVDAVFHINPAFEPDEAEMGIAMVDAAKTAGAGKFVFSGVIHPSLSKLANHAAKLPVEEAIYESGMDWTVLQPALFMQTLKSGWSAILQQGRFALPYSIHQKASYVDYRDVAEAAALALTGTRLAYGTFELCAPGMLDRVELATLMGEALGRTVEAGELPFDKWAELAKLPEGTLREGFRKMYAHYDAHGFPGGNSLVLGAILQREPRTMLQYLRELVSESR